MTDQASAGTGLKLRSSQFRAEREESWRALEHLVGRAERKGVGRMTSAEILELQSLYRQALSSLSVARSTSLDKGVLNYLEALTARAYMVVYGARSRFWSSLVSFIFSGFPAAVVKLRWHLLLSAVVFFMGLSVGYSLTMADSKWYFTLMPASSMQGRSPNTPAEVLREGLFNKVEEGEQLSAFATKLFTNNSNVGLLAFALGFMFGIPTALLLAYNGVMIGAFIALYVQKGLGVEVMGWLSIHGTTEILAILLCGAAGFAIGGAAIFPGRRTRMSSLVITGRQAGIVAIGCVVMFLVAGLLEGFGRQMIVETEIRFLIGAVALTFWGMFFLSPVASAAAGWQTPASQRGEADG